MALIWVGREETTDTRSVKGGLKDLLMQVGTANMDGAPTMLSCTWSGRSGPLFALACGPAQQ